MWLLLILSNLWPSQSAVFDFSQMKPAEGPWGAKVQLLGKNFDPRFVRVYYANKPITPVSVTPAVITVVVPEGAESDWFEIEQGGRRLRAPSVFTVKNEAIIERADPPRGPADILVTLYGRFFTEETEFFLEKLKLQTRFVSEKQVQVLLPPGTLSGVFFCTSHGQRVKSKIRYEVLPFPAVTGISPEKAWHEDKIVIRGKNFCADAAVWVNDREFSVVRRTPDLIEAVVPAGAVTGPVQVRCFGRAFAAPKNLAVEPPYGVITAVKPDAGAPGDWVELSGSAFTPKDRFWLGNAAIAEVKWISESRVQVRIPAQAQSDLFHHESHGRIRPSAVRFTIAYPPELAEKGPVKAWKGDRVVLKGKNFCTDARVEVGGVAWAVEPLTATTEIALRVPPNAANGKLALTCRHWRIETDFELTPPVVAFTSVGPESGPPGTEIVVEGKNFPPDAQIFVGKLGLSTRVEGSRLSAMVPMTASGPISVQAYERRYETGKKFSTAFLKPEPSGFAPAVSWHLGTVKITGRNLCDKPAVFLNKTGLKVLSASATEVVVQLPANAQPGTFSIECYKHHAPVPGKLELRPPVGNIASVYPLAGPPGTVLTVRGSQLRPDTAFFIGTVKAPSRFVSDSEVQLTVPEGASGKIAVAMGKARVETDFAFTLAYPQPQITAVSPDMGWIKDRVTLEGSAFCPQAEVLFPGGRPARIVARTTHVKLVVEVPEGAESGFIVVRCPGVEGKAANYFTVAPPYARISAVSAETGCGGDEVTLTGVNFNEQVRFYLGENVLSVRILSATQAVAIIPANARSGDFSVESFGKRLPTRFSFIIKSRLCRGK